MNIAEYPAGYKAFCQRLIAENPDITPSEMCRNMHLGHYAMADCAAAVHQFFQNETA